ncbi:MAG TPA: phosphotransferase, partial [Micromonosporaceae bacterium]
DMLTPNPTTVTEHLVDRYAEEFNGWHSLATQPGIIRPDEFAWAWRNLDRLASLEASWTAAVADGTTLVHCDVRADNILLTERGVFLVDWPHAVAGPAWIDLLLMMPSAMMQGIDDAERVWRDYPPARRADPDAVNAVLAAVAGFFVSSSLQPAPLNLPNLRAFQAAQGRTALTWLRERLG